MTKRKDDLTADVSDEATTPAAADAPATHDEHGQPFVYRFMGGPDRWIAGIPARDLTQLDLDRLDPAQLRDATLPGPDGTALYVPA